MATLEYTGLVRQAATRRSAVWLASLGALTTLLALLTIDVAGASSPSYDLAVMEWVAGWDLPGLDTFFGAISFLTSAKAGFIYGPAGIAILLLLGKTRAAIVFAVLGLSIALVAITGDYTLGEVVGRGRPLAASNNPTPAFPSGHVLGSTVFFGFIGFLAVYYRLKKKLLVPLLLLFAAIILLTGPARVYDQAHWPSDVAAGYLLGVLWLLVLVPVFIYIRGTKWMTFSRQDDDISALSCESCRLEMSIASTVLLDPQRGTATKLYRPPPVVRLLYWFAFQARFPYEGTMVALEAARHRREIASRLTTHRFGKDLVAHVRAVNCIHDRCTFVTEYVPGEKAKNDAPAKEFLAQVAETFAEAGLSVWQVNPRNPHAHTNLILTPEGDFKIIDLESAVVTLLPAPGQWRSSLRSGKVPVFDDIDFPRLRRYVGANATALEASLGAAGLAELNESVARCELAVGAWKDAEPRVWGRLTSGTYRLLDWKGFLQHLMHSLVGARVAGEAFLGRGVTRWEAEGRLAPSEVAWLRNHLSTPEVADALRHLGAHLVLSAIPVPIPGLRSAARFTWTLGFWGISSTRRLRYRTATSHAKLSNIHTPLVMALALIPGFGAAAYLAAGPLRKKLLVRLMVDQIAWKLPFKLYWRLHLGRWLAPSRLLSLAPIGADNVASGQANPPTRLLGLSGKKSGLHGHEIDEALWVGEPSQGSRELAAHSRKALPHEVH